MRRPAVRWIGAAAVAVLLLVGTSGFAGSPSATDTASARVSEGSMLTRAPVFTLFTSPPSVERGLEVGRGGLTVGPDHTVYWLNVSMFGEDVFALRPRALRPVRVLDHFAEPFAQSFTDVAAAADGSLLVVSGDRIWRLAPDGRLSHIAGTGDHALGGDGGPATAAELCFPGEIVARPDGGIVFSDAAGQTVRQIDTEGRITTLFTPEPGAPPAQCDGGGEGTMVVGELAALADGQVLALIGRVAAAYTSEPSEIVRIDRDGRREVVVPRSDRLAGFAATADGTIVTWEFARDGTPRFIARTPGERARVVMKASDVVVPLLDDDGAPAARYRSDYLDNAAFAPDGGMIVALVRQATEGQRLVYLAPATPTRTAVALKASRGRTTPHTYRARFLTTTQAVVTLTVDRGARRLATTTASLARGRHTLVARSRLRLPVAAATVRLTASDSNGQRAGDTVRIITGGRLSPWQARKLLRRYLSAAWLVDPAEPPGRLDGCQRFSDARVDCRYKAAWECRAGTARLARDGIVRARRYARCPPPGGRFPARPRYSRDPDWRHWRAIGPAQRR